MSSSRHWSQIEESSFALGMWFLFGLYRCLGRWPFRVFLYPVILYYWASKPLARKASHHYLQHFAKHYQRPAPKPWASLRHLLSFGEALLDKLLAWSGGIKPSQVDLIGGEISTQAVGSGKGGLIITAHMGNLELSNVLSGRHKTLKLNILTHTKHSEKFNRMLGKLNAKSQVNLIQVTEISPATTIMLADKIAAGEFVVIAGDRIPVSPGAPVVMAPFLGENAPFPVGPWILASVLHCPVFLLWSLKIGDRYRVSFEAFRDEVCLPRANRVQATHALVTDFASHLENNCKDAPLQWFNFFDFWALPAAMHYKIWA